MTTVKRLIAVVLAVMLVASIGVFAASAEDPTMTIKIDNTPALEGFTYTIYKIASVDTQDGEYTFSAGVAQEVKNEVNKVIDVNSDTAGADFRDALDAIYETKGASAFGTVFGTVTASAPMTGITDEGIFYGVVTDYPDTKTLMNNVVIVWPEYDSSSETWDYKLESGVYTANLSGKVNSGTADFHKYFKGDTSKGSEPAKREKIAKQGETVNFVLEATVVGSKTEPANKFVIYDEMCKGLTYNNDLHVYLDDPTKSANDDALFTIDTTGTASTGFDETNPGFYAGGKKLTVSAKADTLAAGSSFYDATTVYVTYSAKLNNNATLAKNYNPNDAQFVYNTKGGVDNDKTIDDDELKVFTFAIVGKKVNGTDNQPLEGATFVLSDKQDFSNILSTAKSDANGNVVFKAKDTDANPVRLKNGTYYVKETDAPEGFVLSTEVYTITFSASNKTDESKPYVINQNNTSSAGVIKNFPAKLPETGGMGTMMFTIGGACLILAAGVMFVIIMKKRSSSK